MKTLFDWALTALVTVVVLTTLWYAMPMLVIAAQVTAVAAVLIGTAYMVYLFFKAVFGK